MRELLRRTWYLLRRRDHDEEVAEELELHRALTQQALEADGLAANAAALATRRAMGNDVSARQRARDVWVAPWLQDIGSDIKFAVRMLMRDRWLAFTAILALAVGSGVNTAMFAIFNAYCLAGVPIAHAGRVIHVATRDLRQQERGMSFADIEDLRTIGLTSVTGLASFSGESASLGSEGRAPDRVFRSAISANGFAVAGVTPLLGRDFRADDDRPGAPPTVILGEQIWRTRFDAQPSVIGSAVTVNGVAATVIGVMPAGFRFPNRADLWQPLRVMTGIDVQARDVRVLGAFGRLNDDASVARAQVEFETVSRRLAVAYPATNTDIQIFAEPINRQYNADITQPAWAAFVTIGVLVLLIAWANVANLLLSRSMSRSREMAVRASLGATRRRVVRQLLVESGLIGLLGALAGLGVARIGLLLWTRATPDFAIPNSGFTLDPVVLAVFAVMSCTTAFVFGLAPALTISKTDVNRTLKDGGRGVHGPASRKWTIAFLTIQLAVTVLLLINVSTALRRANDLERIDRIIDPTPLMTASLALPAERYQTAAARLVFHDRLTRAIAGIGEVTSFTVATSLPVSGAPQQEVEIDGSGSGAAGQLPAVRTVAVGPHYLATVGQPLLRGRDFDDRDGTAGQDSVVVNQRFVELHYPASDPLGQRVRVRRDRSAPFSAWMTIVGVTPTVRQRPVPDLDPVLYLPFRAQVPATAAVIARSTGNPGALSAQLRAAVQTIDPDLPLYQMATLEQAIAEASFSGRLGFRLLLVIAGVAAGLSFIGLYAVMTHAVMQRTAEFGVRLAFGARPWQLGGMVAWRVAAQAGAGLIAGLLLSTAWSRLFGETGTVIRLDVSTVASVTLLIAIAASLASLIPVRRAVRVDPMTSLRQD